jgi:hypothetical protein
VLLPVFGTFFPGASVVPAFIRNSATHPWFGWIAYFPGGRVSLEVGVWLYSSGPDTELSKSNQSATFYCPAQFAEINQNIGGGTLEIMF